MRGLWKSAVTPDNAPVRDVAIVLGAKPGPLLRQRMDAACDLVRLKKVQRLVLSGLAEEMPFMRERALAAGLDEAHILVDDGATRTLENLRRARDLFGLRAVLVITQRFHMGRALYLAQALGLDAVGVLATGHPRAWSGRVREHVARLRARVDVALL
jgi:vancomycin permeability regulator SanA